MKYVVEVEGDLPAFGALAYAKPLIICGGCKWRGPENSTGFASCYWDAPPRKIYPRDFWCKLGEAEEAEHEHTD